MSRAALVLVALALTGCETSAEKSAKLERVAKQHEREVEAHGAIAAHGLSITRQSTKVVVRATTILRGSEATAAVVTLHNVSSSSLRNVPIELTVRDAHGASLYTNTTPGLSAALVSAPLLPAHGTLSWIDDQVQAAGVPASVSVKIGEAGTAPGTVPRLSVHGVHLSEATASGPGAEGVLVNQSGVSQQELVIYALARRAGRIVAAGRAVLPQAPAGTSTPFQLFFVGDPRGGELEVSAPATTLG